MWDIFELIFGGLFELGEFLCGWRFYLCLLAAAAMIALIYVNVESETLSLGLSIPLAVLALVTGVVWQSQSGW